MFVITCHLNPYISIEAWKGGLEQINTIQMKTGGRELERRSNYVYNGLKGKWISWE